MATKDSSQRRTRYAMNVRLRYRRVAEGGRREKSGWARNLNSRGASVQLPEQVEPGTVLEITLVTLVGTLSLVARVAWARPEVPSAPCLHGVRFRGVTRDQRERFGTLFASERPFPARQSCRLAATCQRSEEGDPAIPGIVHDLSDGGAGVRLPKRVAPGTELCIHAATPFGKLVADAQVVWADQTREGLARGRLYRHGLRFLHVHQSSERPLRALLDGIH
jgi:hypothetical protein